MDELNNVGAMPAVDELVVEDLIIEVDTVETVIEDAPVEIPETIQPETPVDAPVVKKLNKSDNLVVLYSGKDFSGISKGYSKVDRFVAQGMLKNKHIRLATEEEVKTHFSN